MHFYSTLSDAFLKTSVYSQIPADEVLDRQRFIVFRIFSFTALLACIGVFSKMILSLTVINWLPFAVLSLGIIVLANYLRIKTTTSLEGAYRIMLLACLILLHCVAYSCGGIRTGGTFFLTAVIIYAFMLLGKRGGWLITSLAIVHVLVIFYMSTYTSATSFSLFEERLDLINEDFLTNILLTFVLISALSSYLQSGENVVIRRVIEAKVELERANFALMQRNETLERKNEELDKFASVASHDLRAPLRAIGSLTDMVLEDENDLSFDGKEKMNIIRKRVHRMDHLLAALLEYSRINRTEHVKADVEVSNLFVGIIAKHCKPEQQLNHHISNGFPVLHTSPVALERVFDEIIGNAIRFNTQETAEIEITCLKVDGVWQFSVKDNGPGIDSQFKEKVFIIFQTLQARDSFESNGAGLAIAKKFVDDVGGKLWFTNDQDQGVTFHFTWPAAELERVAKLHPITPLYSKTA